MLIADRRYDLIARDAYESIRPGLKYANPLSPFALADAMLVAGEHFLGAGFEAARLRDPAMRAGCGIATLFEAARAAFLQMPQVPMALLASAGVRTPEAAAIAGEISRRAR
ncbi:MAG TPA: hypothetical protein VLC93_11810 [Myxococcota bacterium]|nr:hypothetical protein [Myxococcota bacterium]